MTLSVFIDGSAGTTGLEIRSRLAGRQEFTLITVDEEKRKDTSARREALNDCDIAILCLPDDAAKEAASLVSSESTRIIDASSAHRTAQGWVYGFPEITGHKEISKAKRVSNPGCYPTGFLGLIAPLTQARLLPKDFPYSVNAVSGYSGGGNAMIADFEADEGKAWRGYGYGLDHKHLPEMRAYAGLSHTPIFAPAVIHAHRGMAVEVPLPLAAMQGAASADELRACLSAHYAGSKIISVDDGAAPPGELILRSDVQAWDGMRLFIAASNDGGQARAIALLDNLGKGASGAAVQNLNIMAGLPEETGLQLKALELA